MSRGGLPHSEIVGSKPVCGSPTLIAAYHVLHRLLAPRHSPYALSSLTMNPKRPRAHPPSRAATHRFKNTHCVWSEKLPFAGYSVVKEPASARLRRASARQALALALGPAESRQTLSSPAVAAAGRLRAEARGANRERRMVENTGLEPVTSWLQTRRSPS